MSNMSTWAEREVKFACKKEGECDYGIACYESALKALKALWKMGTRDAVSDLQNKF